MEEFNLIAGIHSIIAALDNPSRNHYRLVGTNDAIALIKKSKNPLGVKAETFKPHIVQEEAKKYYKQLGLEYHRIPSNVFLISSSIDIKPIAELYDKVESNNSLKILCLDQVSDVHNAGAILRTASFYNVDAVVVPDKKSFGLTPSFFRIASGAAEYVPMYATTKLTKVVQKLDELGVEILGLSEHANAQFKDFHIDKTQKGLALVLGKEDTGISNAVLRLIKNKISLESLGDTKSLNVSIAAAVAMEKSFGKK